MSKIFIAAQFYYRISFYRNIVMFKGVEPLYRLYGTS
jgi:hypothetical protein